MTETRWIYSFDEGTRDDRELLGGKGAGLAEMTRMGLPVPPGFTVTTAACRAYLEAGEVLPDGLWDEVLRQLRRVEKGMERRFGDPEHPLLVSVRSGAKFSMPGMMNTVLNLGLNEKSVRGLARASGDERFAHDAHRRLIQMYGDVVYGVPSRRFEEVLEESRERCGAAADSELPVEELQELGRRFREIVQEEAGRPVPEDPEEQLRGAVEAVFASWNIKRARDYREHHGIPHDLGTAANVQAMVFGNSGPDSASGVVFTRNPATGAKELYGEFLPNAQGEDVVAGIRTPRPIRELRDDFPEAYRELEDVCRTLDGHYREMQDIEFTVERGRLWILQTRAGKRTSKAAVVIASDMVEEGLIDERTAVLRVTPAQVEVLLHPRFEGRAEEQAADQGELVARGLGASPGAAVGRAVFDADTAEAWGKEGERVILVRPETTPDDVHGFLQATGVLTQRGGMTSHAAIVSRGLGIPAVVGCEAIRVDSKARTFTADGIRIKEGDFLSVDGASGKVYRGELPLALPSLEDEEELLNLLLWADQHRKLGVRANADTPRDAARARFFGAEGIGLCRTEHMFLAEDRLPAVRRMILARNSEERARALQELLPFQREDFEGVFREMDGLPVIVRLIDPPLHEFLPDRDELVAQVSHLRAQDGGGDELAEREALLEAVDRMTETNPMLGLRGVRLGLLHPEIVEMQVRAIMEAASGLVREGLDPHPEIMIPLVAVSEELRRVRERLEATARSVQEEWGVEVPYRLGTMIELPRACLVARDLAEDAEFFSFGTNDLTQMTYGISRDDAEGRFLAHYVDEGVMPANPFWSLDREGVGELMRVALERGREARADLEVGVCGEHGGDPDSIEFAHELGLDYVSCSPYRIPVARLAAAHAALGAVERDI